MKKVRRLKKNVKMTKGKIKKKKKSKHFSKCLCSNWKKKTAGYIAVLKTHHPVLNLPILPLQAGNIKAK